MKKWRIQTKSIVDLVPHPKNPRQFTEKGMKDLGRSIDAFGLAEPIVVNTDNTICGGHARVMVLKQRGETECECYVPDRQLSEKEVEQLMIRLNANQAGIWDTERLANEWDLSELMDWGLDLSEFKNLEAQEDGYIIPDEIVTDIKRGDLFQIGEHRLMCGDCTKKEDTEKLMAGEKADLLFTDPPYGVSYGDKNKFLNAIGRGNRIQENLQNDTLDKKGMCDLWKKSFEISKSILKDKASYYICSVQGGDLGLMMMMMMEAGIPARHTIIWVKNNHVLSRVNYFYQHEPILFGWNKTHKFYRRGEFSSSVWNVDKPLKSDLHPTMKPIRLINNAILNSTDEGDLIYDSFLGSGSTMVAGEMLQRKVYGIEIDERYCAVIIDRMKKSFPDIEIKRNGIICDMNDLKQKDVSLPV